VENKVHGTAATTPEVAVRTEPLPPSLARFIWSTSSRHQIVLSVLSVAVFVLAAAPLEVQRRMVNDAYQGREFGPILKLAIFYVAVALTEGLLKLGMNIYRGWVGESAVRILRRTANAGQRDPSVDNKAFGVAQLGVGTSIMLAEVEPIAGFVAVSLSEPVLQGGLIMSVLGYMVYLQPWMALAAFFVFFPQIVFVPVMQRAINLRVAGRIATLREVSSSMVAQESAAMESGSAQDLRIDQVFAFNMGIFKLKFSMNFLMNLVSHCGTAAILAIGGWFVLRGQTEIGTVVAFVSGLAKIIDPWGDLVNWFRDLTATTVRYDLLALALNGHPPTESVDNEAAQYIELLSG
jgi:ABC-type multidrug transport system fused ATPase/permease subunit